MTSSAEARQRRIRELIDRIVAGASPDEAESLRRLLSNRNEPYTVIGSVDPALEPLVNELIELRNSESQTRD